MNAGIGKYLIGIGIVIVLIGLVVYFLGDKLSWLGRLPGDIRVEGKNGGFYFPIVTCIVVSLLLNLIIVLIRKFLG
ncbi:DUF2905 domain-containing protein [Larkinella terrae]|uniref:DUF2905 family protein n=1 Tax=Larkinella terrae TaxID=2025311 RepID=A0A7K0ECU1_9BACT|nr:DUF2905 domain-containing protein [Larkinella terrae]MRS59749.1 DUF2905 family protein [Larkinella terrae]